MQEEKQIFTKSTFILIINIVFVSSNDFLPSIYKLKNSILKEEVDKMIVGWREIKGTWECMFKKFLKFFNFSQHRYVHMGASKRWPGGRRYLYKVDKLGLDLTLSEL
ncbi:uncharacterized protein LOC120359617 [Solenopsis invicta]|uniref:uncharacterized protein LOC120359617 n=1 Tax=Solenopsis invicta TaxID=13686 RepID=UPI00193E43DE|nr:uncharacterized protein LOC120359617 [Solenopsis invicta]